MLQEKDLEYNRWVSSFSLYYWSINHGGRVGPLLWNFDVLSFIMNWFLTFWILTLKQCIKSSSKLIMQKLFEITDLILYELNIFLVTW